MHFGLEWRKRHTTSHRLIFLNLGYVMLCMMVSGGKDKQVRVWDVSKATCLATLLGHTGAVRSLSWSEDGMQLASAAADPFPLVRAYGF